jgi:hypothetical protein
MVAAHTAHMVGRVLEENVPTSSKDATTECKSFIKWNLGAIEYFVFVVWHANN